MNLNSAQYGDRIPPSEVKVRAVMGDITKISADAIITAINSGGLWFGGIDGAIQRTAGNSFHAQAANAMPLRDGQVVFARGQGQTLYQNVVFVVDDLQRPLSEIVELGLRCADKNGQKRVLLPAMRMGVMKGAFEKTPDETVAQIALGLRRFLSSKLNRSVVEITFVIYSDTDSFDRLVGAVELASQDG